MAIDRIDRTVVTQVIGAQGDPAEIRRPLYFSRGLTVTVARTVVMVVLASLAILVLLPAVLAAQASIPI